MRRVGEHSATCKGSRLLGCFICIVLLAASLLCLGGCKDSLAIKNIEHDQNAEKIDHESGATLKKPSKSGKLIGEDTDIYKLATKKQLAKRFKVNTKYASKNADTTLPVAKFVYDEKSTNDSEASEAVKEQNKNKKSKQQTNNENNDSSGKNSSKKNEGNDSATNNKNNGSGKNSQGSKGSSEDDAEATVYDTTGDDPKIPDVSSIAATGQTAVIVQMLGGTEDGSTPLKAADADLLKSKFSDTFSDEGSADIATVWKDDGDKNSELDIDALVKAKPDTVLVTSKEYFTKKQRSALSKAGISITVVPSLRSDTRIKVAVTTIGKMLDKATDGKSVTRANNYITYHDNLISSVEGSRGYGAYQKEKAYYFDADASSRSTMFTASKFTLVIDQWDTKATYSYENVISAKAGGVGLSTVGYRTSPISYYLGVAGVVNRAASIETNEYFDGMLAPAWQFHTGTLKPIDVKLSSDIDGTLYTGYSSTGWASTTLTAALNKNNVAKKGFGTDTFPVVIVASADMKKQFQKSAASTSGLYHPFGLATSSSGTKFQGLTAGSMDIWTTIDTDVDLDKQVVVNPKGWFSDWTKGSAESFLECAWAANISSFENDWSGSAAAEVKEFYETFYRCKITSDQAKSILNPEES